MTITIYFAAVTCPFPGNPDNGKTEPRSRSYSVDEVINFKCDEGYELDGEESAICMSSGRFSEFLPTCKGKCLYMR